MIYFVFFLFIGAANLVSCGEIGILVSTFKVDLGAIESYHRHVDDQIDSIIYWSDNIVFNVKRVKIYGEPFLKVDNSFKIKREDQSLFTSDGLFFQNKQVYVRDVDSESMEKLENNAVVSCEPNKDTRPSTPAYLEIRYRSLNEIQQAIRQFSINHQKYFDTCCEARPSTYLATWDEPTRQFIEYTSWSAHSPMAAADGQLLAIIGKYTDTMEIIGNQLIDRLVFDPSEEKIVVPEKDDELLHSVLKDVVGVRMARVGYMSKVQKDKVQILNMDDVVRHNPLTTHDISVEDLLKKTQRTDPMVCKNVGYLTPDIEDCMPECESIRPKEVKFQVHGHILVKKCNYRDESKTELQEDCPFVIEYETNGLDFKLGDDTTNKICTDDVTLWPVAGEKLNPKQTITLSQP